MGVDVAGLKSDAELRYRDAQQFSQDLLPPEPEQVYQDSTNDGAGDLLVIVDADAALEARFGERLRVGVGYRSARWFGALTEEFFPDPFNLSRLCCKANTWKQERRDGLR